VGQSRFAVARGHFGNTKEGQFLPLEAVTRRLVETQQAKEI
jgi:hypothetical protein